MDDSDDDKPLLAPKAKAKTKAKAKAKSAIQKERARQKAKKEDEQQIAALIEEALPKPKQRANVITNPKEDDAKNILRANKKAAARPNNRVERFIIADPPVSQRRKAEIVSDNIQFPRQARPRVK